MLQDRSSLPWHASIGVLLQGLYHWHPCALCARCCGSFQISLEWALSSHTASAVEMHSPMTHPIWNWIPFHIRACKGFAILLNPLINFWKNYTKPKNGYTYYTVVGFGHSLRLHTLASLICSPSGVMSNPRKVVGLWRKLKSSSACSKICTYASVQTPSLII